jgi:hypothetical protein
MTDTLQIASWQKNRRPVFDDVILWPVDLTGPIAGQVRHTDNAARIDQSARGK